MEANMMRDFLYPYQRKAVEKMHNGCILNGGVGSGKSRTGLYYYFSQNGGKITDTEYRKMKNPCDLYIITTAMKRDTLEWDKELANFLMSQDPETNSYSNRIVVDSWNNIKKYVGVTGSFFIFDEQRVVGYGTWTKSFLKIAKSNRWIMLSATPGDTWSDYIPVFIANGYFRNKTDFTEQHVVWSRYTKYPCVDHYINTGILLHYRNRILVSMDYQHDVKKTHKYVTCGYDRNAYILAGKKHWNPFKLEPVTTPSEMCYIWRRITNISDDRQRMVWFLCQTYPKVIIFYNFDYERDILLHDVQYPKGTEVAEWTGHEHQPIPESKRWVYLVQYTAGCEGWNCIETNVVIFYSQSYSYKQTEQACGRIDRLNTPYSELLYYHLVSKSRIDLAITRALKKKKDFNERGFFS